MNSNTLVAKTNEYIVKSIAFDVFYGFLYAINIINYCEYDMCVYVNILIYI